MLLSNALFLPDTDDEERNQVDDEEYDDGVLPALGLDTAHREGQMMRKETRLTTRNMTTEYSQPLVLTLLTTKGRHTPVDGHIYWVAT